MDDTEYSCMIHIPKNEIGWFKNHNCSEEIMLKIIKLQQFITMSTNRIKSKMKSNSKKKS